MEGRTKERTKENRSSCDKIIFSNTCAPPYFFAYKYICINQLAHSILSTYSTTSSIPFLYVFLFVAEYLYHLAKAYISKPILSVHVYDVVWISCCLWPTKEREAAPKKKYAFTPTRTHIQYTHYTPATHENKKSQLCCFLSRKEKKWRDMWTVLKCRLCIATLGRSAHSLGSFSPLVLWLWNEDLFKITTQEYLSRSAYPWYILWYGVYVCVSFFHLCQSMSDMRWKKEKEEEENKQTTENKRKKSEKSEIMLWNSKALPSLILARSFSRSNFIVHAHFFYVIFEV